MAKAPPEMLVIAKVYDLVLWSCHHTAKFPRSHRFTLGDRLEPLFEPSFIFDSYASRPGKGTHAAVDRFTEFARRHRFVLKCDIQKFFPSIDHQILQALVARRVKDRDVIWLVGRIVKSWMTGAADEWFPGDDLLTPLGRLKGLPIGNQTSQFFANVYLNPFDHFVKETLRARSYCRYVDDFVIFDNDKQRLSEVRELCAEHLAGLRLRLHPRKCVVSRVQDGTPFLGFRVFPTHRLLGRANARRMRRRLRRLQAEYAAGAIGGTDVRRRLVGWIGHAGHADTFRLRTRLFSETTFSRRASSSSREPVERPSGAGRVLEQQFEERPVGLPQQQPPR